MSRLQEICYNGGDRQLHNWVIQGISYYYNESLLSGDTSYLDSGYDGKTTRTNSFQNLIRSLSTDLPIQPASKTIEIVLLYYQDTNIATACRLPINRLAFSFQTLQPTQDNQSTSQEPTYSTSMFQSSAFLLLTTSVLPPRPQTHYHIPLLSGQPDRHS